MGSRREGRELALKALYQMDMIGDHSAGHAREFLLSLPANPRSREFAHKLVIGTIAELDYLDQQLSSVITNWSVGRLSRIDHNILRIAAYELIRMDDIPARATMDEAIELAKRYGDRNSGQFVNGVIDMLAQRLDLRHKGDETLAVAKE